MLAYQFRQEIPATHRVTIELPPDAPTGEQAQIIVLFPEKQSQARPNDVNALLDFLATLTPSGRTKEEIEQQIQEERASWER